MALALADFVRIHQTLRVTPAMQAGVTDRLWSMEDVVEMIDDAGTWRRIVGRTRRALA